ncbi:hypothetical protein BC830DRAFT_1077050 [Chytriomyces sp. MP71]|nr:hypothetical protein BC830DRAFT_1077050 [Chytriomyces sp. MP71]
MEIVLILRIELRTREEQLRAYELKAKLSAVVTSSRNIADDNAWPTLRNTGIHIPGVTTAPESLINTSGSAAVPMLKTVHGQGSNTEMVFRVVTGDETAQTSSGSTNALVNTQATIPASTPGAMTETARRIKQAMAQRRAEQGLESIPHAPMVTPPADISHGPPTDNPAMVMNFQPTYGSHRIGGITLDDVAAYVPTNTASVAFHSDRLSTTSVREAIIMARRNRASESGYSSITSFDDSTIMPLKLPLVSAGSTNLLLGGATISPITLPGITFILNPSKS